MFEGTIYQTDFALVTVPADVLRTPARPVPDPTDPLVRAFIPLLEDAMERYRGVGIAGPQVGVPLQIAVIKIPGGDRLGYGLHPDTPLTVLINPRIVDRSEQTRRAPEGCLSIPGYEGIIRRPDRVVVESLTVEGKTVRIDGDKLFGRALQHETDHLYATLYVDRAEDPKEVRQVTPLEAGDPLFGHNELLRDR